MSAPRRRVVWLLGAHQCLVWGLLYYVFTVLLLPVSRDLDVARDAVAAVFSLGLAASALAAAPVGRLIDRGHGVPVMNLASALAVAGLCLAAAAPGLPLFLLAWLLVGVATAGLLYEPVFALLVRAIDDSRERLRALAAVSVLGSLASTLCLPPMQQAITTLGWRQALLVFAVVVGGLGLLAGRWVLPALVRPGPLATEHPAGPVPLDAAERHDARLLDACFALSTLTAVMLIALLLPLTVDRGDAHWGVGLLATWGLLQLPGRLLLWLHGQVLQAPLRLPLALQGCGLLLLALTTSKPLMVFAVGLVAVGAGLMTLARPWWVAQRFGRDRSAAISGRMARHSGFARAAGPWLAIASYQHLGATPLFLLLAGALLLSWLLLGLQPTRRPTPR